jgi:hypothetical protein
MQRLDAVQPYDERIQLAFVDGEIAQIGEQLDRPIVARRLREATGRRSLARDRRRR